MAADTGFSGVALLLVLVIGLVGGFLVSAFMQGKKQKDGDLAEAMDMSGGGICACPHAPSVNTVCA